jgi:hypothetical protein
MKAVFGVGAAAMAALLGGCVFISADESVISHGNGGERLYGSLVTAADTVVITAPSNGCTSKDNFRAGTEKDDGVHRVSFERVRPDNCEAYIPDGVELTWTFAELGVPAGGRVVVRQYSRR